MHVDTFLNVSAGCRSGISYCVRGVRDCIALDASCVPQCGGLRHAPPGSATVTLHFSKAC